MLAQLANTIINTRPFHHLHTLLSHVRLKSPHTATICLRCGQAHEARVDVEDTTARGVGEEGGANVAYVCHFDVYHPYTEGAYAYVDLECVGGEGACAHDVAARCDSGSKHAVVPQGVRADGDLLHGNGGMQA
jgi:hypothetical protein